MFENKAVKEIRTLLNKHNMTTTALAINLNIVPARLLEIMNQRRRISPNTDLRLCKFFKKNCGVNFIDYVIGLKIDYDTKTAQEKMGDSLNDIKTIDNTPTTMKF